MFGSRTGGFSVVEIFRNVCQNQTIFRFCVLQMLIENGNIEELFLHEGSHVSVDSLLEVNHHLGSFLHPSLKSKDFHVFFIYS